jgi:hypothetical protein
MEVNNASKNNVIDGGAAGGGRYVGATSCATINIVRQGAIPAYRSPYFA